MAHINIPIFVPHLGCPHTCVFCNQKRITGQTGFSIDSFHETVRAHLATADENTEKELAFFGGSFTAIDRDLMITLLTYAKAYLDNGSVSSIRLSTRPDAIDEEILSILKIYGVSTIELGIQSTDNTVLQLSKRGHTAKDSENACKLIADHGFSLVGQMMLGLPASSLDAELKTANDMIKWGVQAVRIYPTVVFSDTALADLTREGHYLPLTASEAAERCGVLLETFDLANIPVIRIGLCETDGLRKDNTLCGAYHPALGEMCHTAFFRRKIEAALSLCHIPDGATVTVEVSPSSLSQAIGHKKSNLTYFEKRHPACHFLFKPSFALGKKEVKILTKEN